MAYWNYRVIKNSERDEIFYQIHEVYYDDKNEIESWTAEPVMPFGRTFNELRSDVFYFMSAFKFPVLKFMEDGEKERLVPDNEEQEINPGHYFEVMDRAFVAASHFEEFVASHPVVRKDEQLRKSAQKIMDAMYGLYQETGRMSEEDRE